jgi:hypothetical protein
LEREYIGILTSSQLYREIAHGKKSQILSFFEEAGRLNNVIPCFLRLEDIKPGEPQTTAFVLNDNGEYILTNIAKPSVIHNRGYQCSKAAKRRIERLQAEGICVYNEWNHYGKYNIHMLLVESDDIRPHLPETVVLNPDRLFEMMGRHKELIIKPSIGTFGKRNMKATRMNDTEWALTYPQKNIWQEEIIPAEQLPLKIASLVTSGKYIVQERIPLAEYNENPFDLRVSVQRNKDGEWQVTGMVGKVAKPGSFMTNVAQGGTCLAFQDILKNFPHLDDRQVVSDVERLSLMVAIHLGNKLANLADIGLDVGITNEGFPMFIECNARDLRLTFRHALLFETWKQTYITPISYGKYLLTLRLNQ